MRKSLSTRLVGTPTHTTTLYQKGTRNISLFYFIPRQTTLPFTFVFSASATVLFVVCLMVPWLGAMGRLVCLACVLVVVFWEGLQWKTCLCSLSLGTFLKEVDLSGEGFYAPIVVCPLVFREGCWGKTCLSLVICPLMYPEKVEWKVSLLAFSM